MRVPLPLSEAFGASFETLITGFAAEEKLMPEAEALNSQRYLARSVIPHVQKLSDLFNRVERLRPSEDEEPEVRRKAQDPAAAAKGLAPYWTESSNPANLRLAYFLYFMPANLYRVASVWAELSRLGYRWPEGRPLDAIELGAGPASGACGISAGERHAPCGLPERGQFALIEQDKPMLELGARWASRYFTDNGRPDWGTRTFRRRLDFAEPLLPRNAPRFNLWLSSYFLNETTESPRAVALRLLETWKRHLDDEGLVILVEPALKFQSRKLLEVRQAILEEVDSHRAGFPLQVLLPCLGHQACGALAAEEDWCHEEVSWWRPPYFKRIDQMAGLDRKTLPFSYLVLARSSRPREEILPALAAHPGAPRQRLVSPAHSEGQDLEFFVCGSDGKRRARYRPQASIEGSDELGRGDILVGPQVRGDVHASRIDKILQRL